MLEMWLEEATNYLLGLLYFNQVDTLMKKIAILFLSLISYSGFGQNLELPNFQLIGPLEKLNTEADESNPRTSSGSTRLFYTKTKVNKKLMISQRGQEIWSCEFNNEVFFNPTDEYIQINDKGNNAVVGAVDQGRKLYVFNSFSTRHKKAKGLSYVIKKENSKWSSLKRITIPELDLSKGLFSFFISQDEEVILISASKNNSTYEDLYISTNEQDGSWSIPTSLGQTINTDSIEAAPFLTPDKRRLYFASSGHKGYGSMDIFMSTRIGDGWNTWSTPINLGASINSEYYDSDFILIGDSLALFSSTRLNQCGDLFQVEVTEEMNVDRNSDLVNNLIKYHDKTEDTFLKVDNTDQSNDLDVSLTTKKITSTDVSSIPQLEPYKDTTGVLIMADYSVDRNINTNDIASDNSLTNDTKHLFNKDSKISIDSVFKVYFEFDSKELTVEEKQKLDLFIQNKILMNSKVQLSGYTDDIGNSIYNLKLSKLRADSVYNYLITNGFDKNKIMVEGKGESEPDASNQTKEGRKMNRRVKLTVINAN